MPDSLDSGRVTLGAVPSQPIEMSSTIPCPATDSRPSAPTFTREHVPFNQNYWTFALILLIRSFCEVNFIESG